MSSEREKNQTVTLRCNSHEFHRRSRAQFLYRVAQLLPSKYSLARLALMIVIYTDAPPHDYTSRIHVTYIKSLSSGLLTVCRLDVSDRLRSA